MRVLSTPRRCATVLPLARAARARIFTPNCCAARIQERGTLAALSLLISLSVLISQRPCVLVYYCIVKFRIERLPFPNCASWTHGVTANSLRHTRDSFVVTTLVAEYTLPRTFTLHPYMALLRLDDNFVAPQFFNRISEVQDNLLFYDKLALPIVHKPFDIITITESLHATENSTVYSGYFVDRQGKRYEEYYDVAFKFGDDEKLCQEAEKYDRMSRLQGKAIPRLIGLAFARRTRGGYLGCLMTEKFGASLDCDLISLARSDKYVATFTFIPLITFSSSGQSSSITFKLYTTEA